jgi:hypothetical protein
MPQHHDYPYATVPRLWPGGTVVCMASGPSLTKEDAEYCRGLADGVIVVNTTYQMAPWADVLIASDLRWWEWHKGAQSFKGRKYATSRQVGRLAHKRGWNVEILRNLGRDGLALEPDSLMHGLNTGYRAINLAVHFGASRILLLGYDMHRHDTGQDGKRLPSRDCREHWHGDHPVPSRSVYKVFRKCFLSMVDPLRQLGVEVINCTPGSALECFPRADLRETLKAREVEA